MNINTVENLHKAKIIVSPHDDQITITSGEGHYLADLPYCPEDDEPDIEQDFKDKAEALKAAALFRASYEMAQALKAAENFICIQHPNYLSLPVFKKITAALELSRKTTNP